MNQKSQAILSEASMDELMIDDDSFAFLGFLNFASQFEVVLADQTEAYYNKRKRM